MSGLQRKLPPDDVLRRLRRDGMKITDIARWYGVSISAAGVTCARAEGRAYANKDCFRAPHGSKGFGWSKNVCQHVETTGYAPAVTHDEYPGTDAHALELHECRDLLREWGAAQ